MNLTFDHKVKRQPSFIKTCQDEQDFTQTIPFSTWLFQQIFQAYFTLYHFTGEWGLWCLMPLSTIVQLYRGGTGENHWPVTSHWQTLSHNVVPSTQGHLVWAGFELTMSVVIDTDCIVSYKSNYYTITTTTTFYDQKWYF